LKKGEKEKEKKKLIAKPEHCEQERPQDPKGKKGGGRGKSLLPLFLPMEKEKEKRPSSRYSEISWQFSLTSGKGGGEGKGLTTSILGRGIETHIIINPEYRKKKKGERRQFFSSPKGGGKEKKNDDQGGHYPPQRKREEDQHFLPSDVNTQKKGFRRVHGFVCRGGKGGKEKENAFLLS